MLARYTDHGRWRGLRSFPAILAGTDEEAVGRGGAEEDQGAVMECAEGRVRSRCKLPDGRHQGKILY